MRYEIVIVCNVGPWICRHFPEGNICESIHIQNPPLGTMFGPVQAYKLAQACKIGQLRRLQLEVEMVIHVGLDLFQWGITADQAEKLEDTVIISLSKRADKSNQQLPIPF